MKAITGTSDPTHNLSAFRIPRCKERRHTTTIYGMSFFDIIVMVEKGEVPKPLRIRRK